MADGLTGGRVDERRRMDTTICGVIVDSGFFGMI